MVGVIPQQRERLPMAITGMWLWWWLWLCWLWAQAVS